MLLTKFRVLDIANVGPLIRNGIVLQRSGVKLSGVPPPQDSEHNKNLPISTILLAYIVHYITTSFIFPFVTCSRYASGQVLIHIVCRAVRSRGNWAVELQTKLPEDYAKISQANHRESPYPGLLLVESAY